MLNAAGLTVRSTRPHHHVDPPTGRTATDGAPGLLLPDGDDRGGVLGGRRELLLGAAGTSCTCACGAALTHSHSHSHAAPAPPADRWTDAAFASAMDHGMRDYERRVQGVKRSLFARAGLAGAEVLEVGVGTGPSMGLLAEAGVRRVHGIEPNLAMHGSARRHAEEAGLEVRLEPGRAEALPVADGSVEVRLVVVHAPERKGVVWPSNRAGLTDSPSSLLPIAGGARHHAALQRRRRARGPAGGAAGAQARRAPRLRRAR